MSNSEFNNISTSEFTFKHSDLMTEQTITDQTMTKNINQNGGGIIDSLFGKNELSTLLLETFTDGRPDIACYLLCKQKKCKCDITDVDNTGRNLLHYLTIYASYGNMVIHIGNLIRNCLKAKLKKALKCKDKLGNTPLHYATDLGFNNLVKLYIENGADPSIRNNNGEYVMEDKSQKQCNQELNQPIDVSIIVASPQPGEVLFSPTESFNTDHFIREVENVMDTKNNKQLSNNEYKDLVNLVENEMNEINENINNSIDETTILTEDIIKQIITKTDKLTQPDIKEEKKNIDVELSEILNRVKNNNSVLTGSTELTDFIQKGGVKKSKKKSTKKSTKSEKNLGRLVVGERRLTTYTEMTVSDKSISYDKDTDTDTNTEEVNLNRAVASDDSDISDIARQISRQSSDIHERAVMKIIELLKLDKNNEKDITNARNYKAAIYRMVKEKNPLLNNFDRAVEMEKSITKEVLKSIDIDKVTKEIEQHKTEKTISDTNSSTNSSTKSSTISSKSDSETISATSEVKSSKSKGEKKTKTKKTKDEDGIISIEFSTISQF
jgi:hypothetical protein